MTHFLDRSPLDFADPALRELRDLLAEQYTRDNQVISLVRAAGIGAETIDWNGPMLQVWDEVLLAARGQERLRQLLDHVVNGRNQALGVRVAEIVADRPVEAPPPAAQAVEWNSDDSDDAALERIIQAESTLLDVAFLQRGVYLAAAVCRLLVDLQGKRLHGTAFRIGPDVLLTNHHVLLTKEGTRATAVEAWFGYESTFDGADLAYVTTHGRPDTIVGDPTHDWAVVRVDGIPDDAPIVGLSPVEPVEVDDRVYIIQHPGGGPKKIGMVHNVVRLVDDDVVQYWTDTEGGSSGAPVFNEAWQLVALHHKYVQVPTATGQEYRNQGRRIERVVAGLTAAGVR